MNQLDKIKNQLKNLQQNKNLSDEELTSLATEKLEKDEILSSLSFCLEGEHKFATNLLDKYLSESSLESTSEKNSLIHLIDLEVLLNRIKTQLNVEYNRANPAIPIAYIQQVTELTNQITELKNELGLSKKEQSDFIKTWDTLKKKALKHYEESKGCNTVKCPYCQNLFHLLFDRTDYKEIKSTWFRNTILYNEALFKLYHEKVLSQEKIAEILGVSSGYIELMYSELYLKDLEKKNDC